MQPLHNHPVCDSSLVHPLPLLDPRAPSLDSPVYYQASCAIPTGVVFPFSLFSSASAADNSGSCAGCSMWSRGAMGAEEKIPWLVFVTFYNLYCWCSGPSQGHSQAADCIRERAHAQPPPGREVQASQGEHAAELAVPAHQWQAAQSGAHVP